MKMKLQTMIAATCLAAAACLFVPIAQMVASAYIPQVVGERPDPALLPHGVISAAELERQNKIGDAEFAAKVAKWRASTTPKAQFLLVFPRNLWVIAIPFTALLVVTVVRRKPHTLIASGMFAVMALIYCVHKRLRRRTVTAIAVTVISP